MSRTVRGVARFVGRALRWSALALVAYAWLAPLARRARDAATPLVTQALAARGRRAEATDDAYVREFPVDATDEVTGT